MRDDDTLLVLDMHAVDGLLGMEQVSEAVAEAFLLHSRAQGRVFPVIRERLHTGGVFGIKAAEANGGEGGPARGRRTGEHTSELQSLMRHSYAVLCLKNKNSRIHTAQTSDTQVTV